MGFHLWPWSLFTEISSSKCLWGWYYLWRGWTTCAQPIPKEPFKARTSKVPEITPLLHMLRPQLSSQLGSLCSHRFPCFSKHWLQPFSLPRQWACHVHLLLQITGCPSTRLMEQLIKGPWIITFYEFKCRSCPGCTTGQNQLRVSWLIPRCLRNISQWIVRSMPPKEQLRGFQ